MKKSTKKPTRTRLVMITGLTGLALSTTGCPEEEVITNPPPVVDTGDTGEAEETGSKD